MYAITGCYSLNQLTNAVYEDIRSEGVAVIAQFYSGLFTVGVLLRTLTIIHKIKTQLQRRLFMVLQLTCFGFQLQKIKELNNLISD